MFSAAVNDSSDFRHAFDQQVERLEPLWALLNRGGYVLVAFMIAFGIALIPIFLHKNEVIHNPELIKLIKLWMDQATHPFIFILAAWGVVYGITLYQFWRTLAIIRRNYEQLRIPDLEMLVRAAKFDIDRESYDHIITKAIIHIAQQDPRPLKGEAIEHLQALRKTPGVGVCVIAKEFAASRNIALFE
jgi:hypothetical protein